MVDKCAPSPGTDGRCALHGSTFPMYDDGSGRSRYCLVWHVETGRYLAEAARQRAEGNRRQALEADAIAERLDAQANEYAAQLAAEKGRA